MSELKKTALFEKHQSLGGKIVDFSGWALPIQYESIKSEHHAVRKAAGIFDVSHMGEVRITGNDATAYVQKLITNDVKKLENNQILYTMMCYEDGGVVDDLLVYKYDDTHYYLVINASNIDKDVQWMKDHIGEDEIELVNESGDVSEIAIQGPKAQAVLQKVMDYDLDQIKFFYFKDDLEVASKKAMVSRTGYTGEDGFEIYTSHENIEAIYSALLEAGTSVGINPAGLGARDTLRFEASLPLYGNELSQDITPLEAGLGFFVKLDSDDFIGKSALVKQKSEGLNRKIVGFELIDRGVPRHGYEVYNMAEEKIGHVTTGYKSPTLEKSIGLALIDASYSDMNTEIYIKVRSKMKKAKVISKRFLKKNYKK